MDSGNEPQQSQGFGRGAPRAPKVLPGTYSLAIEMDGDTTTALVEVRGDPRIQISEVDLQTRQNALLSLFSLNQSVAEANRAIRRLSDQLDEVNELLEDLEEVPEEIQLEADSFGEDLDSLRQDLSEASRDGRVSGAIEGSTTRPTDDQLWQMDRAWERVPPLIAILNTMITERLPAYYDLLNEHGIRPDPGEPIVIPRRP